jgi:hypothetical protein
MCQLAAVLTPSSRSSKVCLDKVVNVISEVDHATDIQWWQATYVLEFHLQLLWFRFAVWLYLCAWDDKIDDLAEHDSLDKKDNDDDNDDDQHNNSFQFIFLQAVLTSAYYKSSTKKQNTKIVQIHKSKKTKTIVR